MGYHLEGRLLEVCDCRVLCPCWIGEDPDKRDYIVSNARLASTGFKPEWSMSRGISELIKGFTIIRNSIYSNI